jgi:hypothetical protein
MSLANKTVVERTKIINSEGKQLFVVKLIEETLSDGSKAYNLETVFFGEGTLPVLTLEDATACDYNEAWKKFRAVKNSLSVFEESQVL